ncbi:hypothetical protein O1M63_46365 [Streptomyces mirabilis]|nr:hypothetical protein [Streptomyces mirabilis]
MTGTHLSGCPRIRGDSRPAVVVTDLDGTLLLSDGSVSERAVAALARSPHRGPASSSRRPARPGPPAGCCPPRPVWAPSWCRRTAPSSATWTAGRTTDPGDDTRHRPRRDRDARAAPWAVDREHDRLIGPGWPDILASGAGRPCASVTCRTAHRCCA